MKIKMELPKRHQMRLKYYDYSQNGYYFATICAKGRECLFGTIDMPLQKMNPCGCRIRCYAEKGMPHCHTSMLPIHEKEDGSRSFNVSQHQKGKDCFRGFQDRFYGYMKERYPDKELERVDP